MIIDASGRNVITKEILEMTRDQVRWFLNGKAFLRHLDDLKHVKVAAYCQHCYNHGLMDDVMAGKPDDNTYVVRCAHRQRTFPVSAVKTTDELLAMLGWSLRCDGDCARKGMFDGVQGHNDPEWGTVEVTCGCTDRKFSLSGTH